MLEQQHQRIAVQPQTVSQNGDGVWCRGSQAGTKRVLCRDQDEKQVSVGEVVGQVPEGVAVTVANISSVANSMSPATTLLINPFTIHATSASDASVVQTIAVSNPVVSLTTGTPVPAPAGATGHAVHHHQNVRDMDIVHVKVFSSRPFFSFEFLIFACF